MANLQKYDWERKPRTLLRYIKPGDVFMFQLSPHVYGVGRIIAKVDIGHVAEIFSKKIDHPFIPDNYFNETKKLNGFVVLDSYSLFDKKLEGDWRIVGHQDLENIKNKDDIYFSYGTNNNMKRIDIYGNEYPISSEQAEKYPLYSPRGDWYIKNMF